MVPADWQIAPTGTGKGRHKNTSNQHMLRIKGHMWRLYNRSTWGILSPVYGVYGYYCQCIWSRWWDQQHFGDDTLPLPPIPTEWWPRFIRQTTFFLPLRFLEGNHCMYNIWKLKLVVVSAQLSEAVWVCLLQGDGLVQVPEPTNILILQEYDLLSHY